MVLSVLFVSLESRHLLVHVFIVYRRNVLWLKDFIGCLSYCHWNWYLGGVVVAWGGCFPNLGSSIAYVLYIVNYKGGDRLISCKEVMPP